VSPRRRKAAPADPTQTDFAGLLFPDLLMPANIVRETADNTQVAISAPSPIPRDAFATLAPVYRLKLVQTDWLSLPEHPAGKERPKIRSPRDVAQLLFRYLDGVHQEHFVSLLLDAKGGLIGVTTISIGDLSSSIVHPREVFKPAIVANAANILVAHNHPSGDPMPSPEDVAVTRRLTEASELLGIELLDHVVIGDQQRWVSLKEKGLMLAP
jgi:DNA repair protein RadC